MNEFEKYRDYNPHKVPEDYFDTLEDSVIQRLNSEKNKKPIQVQFIKPWYWGIAASLILFSFTYLLFQKHSGFQVQMAENISEPDSLELVAFENNIDLSEEEFEELIPESVIDSVYAVEIVIAAGSQETEEENALLELEEEYSPLDLENEI